MVLCPLSREAELSPTSPVPSLEHLKTPSLSAGLLSGRSGHVCRAPISRRHPVRSHAILAVVAIMWISLGSLQEPHPQLIGHHVSRQGCGSCRISGKKRPFASSSSASGVPAEISRVCCIGGEVAWKTKFPNVNVCSGAVSQKPSEVRQLLVYSGPASGLII